MARSKIDEYGANIAQVTDREIDAFVKKYLKSNPAVTENAYEDALPDGLSAIEKSIGNVIVSQRLKEFHSVRVEARARGVHLTSGWAFGVGAYGKEVTPFRVIPYLKLLPDIIEHIGCAYDEVATSHHDSFEEDLRSLRKFAETIIRALDKAPPKPERK